MVSAILKVAYYRSFAVVVGQALSPVVPDYSNRNADTGSIRAARRAGIHAASDATPTSSAVAAVNTIGSPGEVPNSRLAIKRESPASIAFH